MRKNYLKDLPVFQFHLLQKFSDQVEHAVFSREGGVSKAPYDTLNVRFGIGDKHKNVQENRKRICISLGLAQDRFISANQTHSKNVKIIDEEVLNNFVPGQEFDDVDAFVTNLPEVGLMMQVADCQAQLMFDPVKRVVAAVHAGWKGLAQDISGAAIDVMQKNYKVDPSNILIGIAPSLGPCCAFFSNPEKELPQSFHKYIDAKKRVDLWSFSLDQLQKHGIEKRNIELAKVCTQCGNGKSIEGSHRFYSFRGEKGVTGRFGVAIYLK